MFNGLKWGPDGWLWGCNGILSISRVGKPGTPETKRVAIDCGVWRYHPTREVFEAVAHGTTNPWGLDFDDLGEAFITNCVIPHLFHVIPGAHFQRMFGEDVVPNRYELMETCADHIHWAGGRWQDSREGKGQARRGRRRPRSRRGDDLPGRQLARSLSQRRLHVQHPRPPGQSRPARAPEVRLRRPAREGFLYGRRHVVSRARAQVRSGRGRLSDRLVRHGRVSRDGFRQRAPRERADLQSCLRDAQRGEGRSFRRERLALARFQLHKNDWYVRTARRLLQERAVAGKDLGEANALLREVLASNPEVSRRLRALWALHATGGLDEAALQGCSMTRASTFVPGRSVCFATLRRRARPLRHGSPNSRRTDPSPKVRLSLASALQRLPLEQRWDIAEPLASHQEDASDRSLSLMIWYGVEPLVPADRSRAVNLAAHSEIPICAAIRGATGGRGRARGGTGGGRLVAQDRPMTRCASTS